MATKTEKTTDKPKTAAKAAPKTAKAAPKAAPKTAQTAKAPKAAKSDTKLPAHPHARVIAKHSDRATLVKSLVEPLARADQDTGALETTLGKVSNHKLLRLARVAETVKSKYGSRSKLIAAIGAASAKAKDKDFLAKLDTYSLPQLLDLATAGERRARQ